jgi:2-dehydropantoate 2-reductase
MRILVVGAGAVGGYAAARMLEAGADVTLFVREGRKRQLDATGLEVRSPLGDYTGRPNVITAGNSAEPYDLVLIAMKAYGLSAALEQIRPFIGPGTVLLPFLNGIRHMEVITASFPGTALLGGVARIESTLDAEGRILHDSSYHSFTYGRYGEMTDERYRKIQTDLARIPLLQEHADVVRDLWEKYLLITVLSGSTTLYDASIGEIRESPDGLSWFRQLLSEAAGVIRAAGGRLGEDIEERLYKVITGLSYGSTASMHRDLRQGFPTEAEHIHGYLLELARRHGTETPLLQIIHRRLTIYEQRRNRADTDSSK